MLKKFFKTALLLAIFPISMFAQETNSSIGGFVKSGTGEVLVGATIKATHLPTGTTYQVIARAGGRYDINNMTPGGPYLIVASFVSYQDEKREDVYLTLGEKSRFDFALVDKSGILTELVVTTRRASNQGKGGTETGIGQDKVTNMPTVSRSLSDYLRYTPQAKVTGDGGVSIAGQNNRYNAFYIDGAINNDVFGLAASGTNGGQANINPISIDAIDQFQVVISPYDASIGGFTGGGINATTRSGTNEFKGSAWYYYRNENLAGTTPGNLPDNARTKLPDLKNSNVGLRFGGPIVKNKIFFFVLAELQRDKRPQLFNFADYRGFGTADSVNKLVNFLNSTYNYDPGSYLDIPEKVNANRIQAKLDWNLTEKNRLSLSYRFNDGTRYNTSGGSSTRINFFNNGYLFPNTTNTFIAELKSTLKNNASNRLLVTFTNVEDNRDPIGKAFPRITINDGTGSTNGYIVGTENFSTGNFLLQKNLTLYDAYKFYVGNHLFSLGTDILFSKANNLFIRDLYGTYTYASLNDFITNARPTRYDRTFSLLESKTDESNSPSAARFKYYNLAFFVNDEIKATDRLTLNLGIRADKTIFPDDPKSDPFFNDTAIVEISKHYNTYGARSGQMADVNWSISPRIGFVYKIPEDNITIRGGAGFFTGRMPLVWPGGVYNNTGINLGSVGINNPNITFRPDPFNQYGPTDFGVNLANSKGQVDIISKDIKLPRLFRTSLGVDKNLGKGWNLTIEGLFSKNINEIYYQNVNIIPPSNKSVGAGSRTVYTFSGTPSRIPMRPGGINPYAGGEIFLLSNAPKEVEKGFAYNFSFIIDKRFSKGFSGTLSYTYGSATVINEGTSSQNNSQWRFMETVNGRNYMTRSTSDFDLGHRIYGYLSKKFTYANQKLATTISLVLNSQQGQPFSYVYSASPVGDRSRGETNDLIYIPTAAELQGMVFLTNTVNGVAYSAAEQKTLLENYIQNAKYLNSNRGRFAERNGDRLPWSTILDLKIQQDFNLKLSGKTYTFQISYDVYNFTNMISKKWGQTYFLSNDNYSLIQFAGFVSATDLTPQYRFNPQNGKPWGLSTTNAPGLSARWISQLGIRVIF
ncbi:MAG TPA: TonB-dependent receptor [Chitinophagaceae bacterium]|nr:TonB-dependent receptor [Chitinophagaceae bacterium]